MHQDLYLYQQETIIKNDLNVKDYKKVLDRGAKLYFRVKRKRKGHDIFHEFEVELLEDLYFYLKKKAKKDDSRLYDCACVVRRTTGNTLKMFEEILGKSLNQVFKNTFVHYFGNQGAPSCNAINRFYEGEGQYENYINQHRMIEKKNKGELNPA